MIQKLLANTGFRYLMAGGSSYALELFVLIILHKKVGLSAEISTALSFWVGLLSSFTLQKLVAFQDYEKAIGVMYKQTGIYAMLVCFNYAFTLLVVGLFPAQYLLFSRTGALIATTIWNYFIYKKLIFKKS